ncbi:MAG: hypothetical protein P8Y95_01700 [Gammaproteobacteria bacterium]|jgi:hypothetical protein
MRHLVGLVCCIGMVSCTSTAMDSPFQAVSEPAACKCSNVDAAITDIALGLQNQHIMFSQTTPKSDCAGIFHRVLDGLSTRCACFAPPPYRDFRTSRQLAHWYYEQGNLSLVTDPLKESSLIEVGAVMFYGSPDRDYHGITMGDLFRRGIGVEHMGIVVYVERDEYGYVRRYTLFHGRGPGMAASATYHHTREDLFGNAAQPWIAIAPVIPKAHEGFLRISSIEH